MGSLKGKIEGEIEIRATAGDVHHEIYECKPHQICHASPHFIRSCEHEGELGKPGSIITWTYNLGGRSLIAKNKIIEIDNEKKLVRQQVVGGDALNDYKTFVGTSQVIPKNNETSIVKWTIEYEKLHSGVPEPTVLLDALLGAAKDIDDHHHGIEK